MKNIKTNKPLESIKKAATKDKKILAVFLFGSAARKDARPGSDVDICLALMPGIYSSKGLSEQKIKYLALFNFDIQIFQQIPLYIRQRVLKEGKLLFCRDEDKLYELAFATIRELNGFEHIYRDYLKEVSRG